MYRSAFITWLFPFLKWRKSVNRDTLIADFMAGLTGAVIVLPQGVAYALIAGLPAEYGLYTAIVPAIIAALYGSSWHLVSGPTAAISVVVFSTISPMASPGTAEFVQIALLLALFTGVIQLVLGLLKMGVLVNFVSHSVVVGFTAGAAIVIATNQLANVLGLSFESDGTVYNTWLAVAAMVSDIHVPTVIVAVTTLLTSILVKRYHPEAPNLLFAMLVGLVLALVLPEAGQPIAMVGEISGTIPSFDMPDMSMERLQKLSVGAMAVSLLGLVEAVSIARSVATRSHQHISGSREFIGQGLSNIIGSLFSSYASSGSFTRTGLNYEAGARTPLAAVFAAVVLAAGLPVFALITPYVPIPSMAAILLVVAYGLIDWHQIRKILRAGSNEYSVFVVTFLSTLFLQLEFAVYVGVLLSLVLYLRRTSRPRITTISPDPNHADRAMVNVHKTGIQVCPQLRIIRIDGSLFFGAVSYLQETLNNIETRKVMILASGVNFIDLAGCELLRNESRRRRMQGGALYLSNIKQRVLDTLRQGGHLVADEKDLDGFPEQHIYHSKTMAISKVTSALDLSVCHVCEVKAFRECEALAHKAMSRPEPVVEEELELEPASSPQKEKTSASGDIAVTTVD